MTILKFNFRVIAILIFTSGCFSAPRYQYELYIEFESPSSEQSVADSLIYNLKLNGFSADSCAFFKPKTLIQEEERSTMISVVSTYKPCIEIIKRDRIFKINIYTPNYRYGYNDPESIVIMQIGDIIEKWAGNPSNNILNFSIRKTLIPHRRSFVN